MRAHDPEGNIVQRRPAETVTFAFALASVIGLLFGLDREVVAWLVVIIGGIPTIVTAAVELRRPDRPPRRRRRRRRAA